MCPLCVATVTQIAAGAAFGGAWTAFILRRLRTKIRVGDVPQVKISRRLEHE